MFNFSLRRPGWSKAAAQAGLDLAILLPQPGLSAYFLLTKTKMKVLKNKKRSNKCKVVCRHTKPAPASCSTQLRPGSVGSSATLEVARD